MGPRTSSALRSTMSDAPVACLNEREAREGEQSECDCAEQPRAVGSVVELAESAVEADRLVCLVVDCGLDEEDADEPEHDCACDMTDRPERLEPRHEGMRNQFGLRVVEKLLPYAADELVDRN